MPAYVSGKHGIAGLARAAAFDLVRFGIRVNAVCPGFIETPMLAPLVADPQEFEIEHRHQVATPNDAIRETGA